VGLELRDQGDPFIGTTIGGRFKVSSMLGQGGMGSVYLARQLSVDRDVAIKILRKDTADDTLAARRFLLEAKATSRLTNDHTVTIYDFGQTDDGHLFIAMEFLAGRTLRAKLDQEGALSLHDAVSIIDQMGESLAEAHEQGIVHRDLKPENILLAARAKGAEFVKVLDFGIARAQELNDGGALTATGTVAGTPAYMSPEAVTGRTVDARADVYALGVMIYEMLTGEAPFRGDTPFVVMQQHVMHDPPPLMEMLPELPDAVSSFVARCIMKDPTHRPLDAAAFRRGLELAMEGKDDTSPNYATLPGHPNVPGAVAGSADPVSASAATGAAFPTNPAHMPGGFDQTMPGASILTPEANPVLGAAGQAALGTDAVLDQLTTHIPPPKGRGATIAVVAAVVLGLAGVGVWQMTSPAAPKTASKSPASKTTKSAAKPTPAVDSTAKPAPKLKVEAKAPAPVPAAPAMVSVSIVTVPQGVEVRRGGKVLGTTPTMIALPKSTTAAQLLLTKAGFDPKAIEVVPSKNQLVKETLISNAPPEVEKPKAKARPRSRARSKPPKFKPKPAASKPKPKPKPKPASRLDEYLD